MAEPFLSEIRIFSFDYPPQSWAFCNGQLLPINQNQALFSLLGTTYGGDGRVNFALPDLRHRVPIHEGAGHTLGERAGETTHTVSVQELPQHVHHAQASTKTGDTAAPTAHVLADTVGQIYGTASNLTSLTPATVTTAGGSQPHENMQPYLVLNFCIALQGIFPSTN